MVWLVDGVIECDLLRQGELPALWAPVQTAAAAVVAAPLAEGTVGTGMLLRLLFASHVTNPILRIVNLRLLKNSQVVAPAAGSAEA